MNVELLALAKFAECRFSLGTDSHGPSQLGFAELGLAAALSSAIQPARIVPKWLADRMTRLGTVIAESVVHHSRSRCWALGKF